MRFIEPALVPCAPDEIGFPVALNVEHKALSTESLNTEVLIYPAQSRPSATSTARKTECVVVLRVEGKPKPLRRARLTPASIFTSLGQPLLHTHAERTAAC
jgi:hypothetical protein